MGGEVVRHGRRVLAAACIQAAFAIVAARAVPFGLGGAQQHQTAHGTMISGADVLLRI